MTPLLDNSHLQRFARIRDRFPGAKTGPYLDVSARGLLYDGAREALDAYLDRNAAGTLDKGAMFAGVEKTRALFASLVRAEPDEIAFTRNVTDGIATFGASLPWQSGDNVVVCESLEHPANIFPWYGLSRRLGITVKTVGHRNGHIPLDGILAQIDDATRVVAVSAVSFAPGFRFPVAELGAECRRRGVLLIVDGAQSIGVLDTDVKALNVDALAASTQKSLMGLYGMGFLYVRKEVAEALAPVFLSRFGVDLEGQHEASAGDAAASYKLAQGARRFDVGNYNYPAILAVGASLELLLELGSKEVEAFVCGLARDFANGMVDAGLSVFGGRPGPLGTHIVTVGKSLGFDHDSAADKDMSDLYAFLTANGVRLGIRRDLLRFSFHIYNNQADILRVLDLVRQWTAARSRSVA
ncbi:MAG: Selenocysteine lyase/Cysteine desulfurase [Rhodospirillales bacterium]|nr:Selenocysteine lyase/Cysteine desulfurase [Rhodospirillales bacterium]